MLAFFLHVRYNSHVKYFEVFEIYFINSDIRKYFMEIRNLITFTKVAETQSLSKAAKALGYAQSTVTMQMQQLEQELGAQLYERVGKQIRITQTGQEFLSYAAAIVRNTNGEYGSRLEVYKKDGTHVLSKEFNFEYTHADFDGDLIILYNEDSCRIYNMSGTEKFDATFDFPVSRIRKGRFPGTLVVTGPQQMRELKLH